MATEAAGAYVGQVSPYGFRLTIKGGGVFDLSTVTAASMKVQRADGTISTWGAVIEGIPTSAEIVIFHPYVPGDLPIVETLLIYGLLSIPGGTIRSKTVSLPVRGEFE